MIDYKYLYLKLFNGITDAAKSLETISLTAQDEHLRNKLEENIIFLRQLQLNAENKILSSC